MNVTDLQHSFYDNSIFLALKIYPHIFPIGGNFVQFSMNSNFCNHGLLFVRA